VSTAQWLVTALGAVLIVAVNLYFLGPRRRS
jgi:hypothetical protein